MWFARSFEFSLNRSTVVSSLIKLLNTDEYAAEQGVDLLPEEFTLPDNFFTHHLRNLGWILEGFEEIKSTKAKTQLLKACNEGMREGTARFVQNTGL